MFDSATFHSPARRRDVVIALHCSGAAPSQWLPLATALGPSFQLSAPAYYGSDERGPWSGAHAFTLADEAAATLDLIDRTPGKVHLVGHSYGGAVALHIAAQRRDRLASLTLYEPAAFHLLKSGGAPLAAAFIEIDAVSREAFAAIARGEYRRAAEGFVDYWGGRGAWSAMRPSLQRALTGWVAKIPLDFHATMAETTPLAAYADPRLPVLLLRGEYAPLPTRTIADLLYAALPAVQRQVMVGAGHMGPLTHPEAVATAISRHIADSRARQARAVFA